MNNDDAKKELRKAIMSFVRAQLRSGNSMVSVRYDLLTEITEGLNSEVLRALDQAVLDSPPSG